MTTDLLYPALLGLAALAWALFGGDRPRRDTTPVHVTQIHHHAPPGVPAPLAAPPATTGAPAGAELAPASPRMAPAQASVTAVAADLHRAKPAPYRQVVGPVRKTLPSSPRRQIESGADRD